MVQNTKIETITAEPIKTVLQLIIELFELTILNDGLNFEELTKFPWSDPATTIAIDPAIDLAMDVAMDPVMAPALIDPAIDPAMTRSFPEFEITGEITATDGGLYWTGDISLFFFLKYLNFVMIATSRPRSNTMLQNHWNLGR